MIPVRKRIYDIINKDEGAGGIGYTYDIIMLTAIVVSIIPLTFHGQPPFFVVTEKITVSIFIVDYILRWMTADYKFGKCSFASFARYPFSFMAIIDLLSILPGFNILGNSFKALRISRMLRIIRMARFFRYSKQFNLLFMVLKKERSVLLSVLVIALMYIFTTALIMFNAGDEEIFDTFFKALYWATTTLTTVGYGDIYPVSDMGRLISMISAIFGVAIIALPSGIITASYLEELKKRK